MDRSLFRNLLFDDSDEDEIIRQILKDSTSPRKRRWYIERDCLASHKRLYFERGLHLDTSMWIFKVSKLSTLIFGRLHVYICMWILKIGRLSILIFDRLHIYIYIYMWIF